MTAKKRVSELETALEAKDREVKVLEGRVRGYQEALLTKAEKDAKAKFHECADCGAVWLDEAVPTHRLGCRGWRAYLLGLMRRSGYRIQVRRLPKRLSR